MGVDSIVQCFKYNRKKRFYAGAGRDKTAVMQKRLPAGFLYN